MATYLEPSSVGPAVFNFYGAVNTALGGSVQFAFGELTNYIAPVTLQILEVTGDQQPAEIGNNFRREETFSIVCELVTWAGDQNYQQRFTDALTAWNTILVTVGNNPWLSTSGLNDATAAVRYAEVGDFSFIPHADAAGQSRCSLQFHVRCSQRINSLS